VYKLRDDLAIVQTVDFFTPIVDDPYTFGQIAVANALSDVYAMGSSPLTAMNIVCFPIGTMQLSVLETVLAGGLDKLVEAGVTLVGGHSVEDKELKYGLSVTGIVDPRAVIRNRGAQVGDRLILTKPLGTGIISTALKAGVAPEVAVERATRCMLMLNRSSAELMRRTQVHACTDVTGFGLLGHACEMIEGSNVGMAIWSSSVPCLAGARNLAEMGFLPGGLHRNRSYAEHMVSLDNRVPQSLADVLYDPQTSGGLLISLPGELAEGLLEQIHGEGIVEAAIIGEIVPAPRGRIVVI
jgi:selenide,water dikinase